MFPIVAGIFIGLLVPRFGSSAQQRRWVYAFLAIAVAALAAIVAREEWFFIFIHLADVFLALGVSVYVSITFQAETQRLLRNSHVKE